MICSSKSLKVESKVEAICLLRRRAERLPFRHISIEIEAIALLNSFSNASLP